MKKLLQTEDRGFNRFWAMYPKHVARLDALKAWTKLHPTPELVDRILAALEVQKLQESWQRERGQFVPHAATWIRGERWLDEYETPATRKSWRESCQHQPCCQSYDWHCVLLMRERGETV